MYFICFSPWKYLSKTRHNLYDRLWDSGWEKLGCIYVWTSGAKTPCWVEINHSMAAPGLSPTDWVLPRRGWHAAIVGLNLRISSANLAGRSASRALFPRFLLRLMNRQLEATTICVPVSWRLLKMLVTPTALEQKHALSRGVESTSELFTWSPIWIQSWFIVIHINSISMWRSWL